MGEAKRKYNKFLKIIYIVCGFVGFLSYFMYFTKQFIWYEGTLPFAVAIAGCLVAGIPVFFRKFFEKHLPKKLFKVLENIFAWGMLFYSVTFIALAVFIFSARGLQAEVEDLPQDTAFVVFGSKINGENPSSVLKKRLNKTIEYMEALPDSICVVTGGQGSDEICPEAEVMKNYLVENGIDESRILVEDKARNTVQNVKYAAELLEASGMDDRHVVSVSNAFHIPRIKLICSRLDVDSDFVLAKDPNWYTIYPTLVREYMSYAKLLILGTE